MNCKRRLLHCNANINKKRNKFENDGSASQNFSNTTICSKNMVMPMGESVQCSDFV
jgi:hypothetical protein